MTLPNQWDGDADGWYPDWSMERYLACRLPGSGLVKRWKSRTPFYIRWCLDGNETTDETSALRLGELVHTAVLEPDFLSSMFLPMPEPDPERHTKADGTRSTNPANTKAYKDEVAELEDNYPDATLVSAADYGRAMAMRDAVHAHSRASALIHMEGPVETSITWTDPETGVRCKIRPDKLVEPIGGNLQVKTTRNPGWHAFQWDVAKFGYHISEAFYMRGLKAAGFDVKHPFILAIGSDGPLEADAVAVYELDDGTVDAGDQLVSRYLRQMAYCFERNHWPGLPDDHIPLLSLPHREWNRVADEVLEPPPYLPAESLEERDV